MLGVNMISLPPDVAAKILTTLVTENERLTAENQGITRFRGIENEALTKAMRALEQVREVHHWIRKIDGSESCSNCGGVWPCDTIKAINHGEEEPLHVDH